MIQFCCPYVVTHVVATSYFFISPFSDSYGNYSIHFIQKVWMKWIFWSLFLLDVQVLVNIYQCSLSSFIPSFQYLAIWWKASIESIYIERKGLMLVVHSATLYYYYIAFIVADGICVTWIERKDEKESFRAKKVWEYKQHYIYTFYLEYKVCLPFYFDLLTHHSHL